MAKDKNGNGAWRKAGVVLTVIVLGVSVVAGFVSNSDDIEHNTESIADHETRVRTNESAITSYGKDIGYIRQSVERIEKKLDK